MRNQGYEIEGSEKYRRLITANTLVMEINEYQFFHLLETDDEAPFIFQFLSRDHLLLAQRLIRETIEPQFKELSDRKLAFIVLMLALAMDRVALGYTVEEETYPSQINKDLLKVAKRFLLRSPKRRNCFIPSTKSSFAVLLGDFANSFDRDF